jgi:hypothetical protein
MKRALAPPLHADEELSLARSTRDPAAPARPSESAPREKREQVCEDGSELHGFATLMIELGTRCRTTHEVGSSEATRSFQQLTRLTPFQAKAFRHLDLLPKP